MINHQYSKFQKIGLWKLADYPEYAVLMAQMFLDAVDGDPRAENYPDLRAYLRSLDPQKWIQDLQADVFGNMGEDCALCLAQNLPLSENIEIPDENDKAFLLQFARDEGTALDFRARKIVICRLLNELIPSAERLEEVIRQKAEVFGTVRIPARRHLQEVQGTETLEDEWKICLQGVQNARIALLHAAKHFETVEFSAGRRPDYLNLGCEILAVHGAVRQLSTQVWRIANDIRLRASGPRTGFCELTLPAVAPGSSIMPGKLNPVIAEMVYATVDQVDANDASIGAALKSGWLETSASSSVVIRNFIESARLLRRTCDCFIDKCLLGIEPSERLKDAQ